MIGRDVIKIRLRPIIIASWPILCNVIYIEVDVGYEITLHPFPEFATMLTIKNNNSHENNTTHCPHDEKKHR